MQGVTCIGPGFPNTGESGDDLEGCQRAVNDLFGRVNYLLGSSIRDEPNHGCVICVLDNDIGWVGWCIVVMGIQGVQWEAENTALRGSGADYR